MPGKSSKSQRNLSEQADELRRKKLLLEGEQKAYYEGVEYSRKQLDEQVSQLQVENSDLRKLVADKLAADEYVVSKGLEGNETERKALRNKPGRVAIVLMDEKVRDRVNVLNSLQYTTRKKEERLKELETQQQKTNGGGSSDANANNANESEDAQKLRNLENRLDKANLKCKEADHIQKTYLQIKSKLEDEHKTFENTLDEMEQDVRRLKVQLKQLRVMHDDAIIRRDKAKADLEREEKEIYADRKQRELEIQKVRKEAEEKKVQAQLIQRRIDARASMAQDDMTAEQRHQLGLLEEDHEKIKTYEEAFRRIKDATGVSDTRVVLRFENQGETQRHLEQLKEDNEEEIKKLADQKIKLQVDYEQMKYSGEAKLSSGQHLLEEYEQHLADEELRHDVSQAKLEKRSKMLGDVKSGVEHLTEKLKTLKTPPSNVLKPKIPAESDEFVLDQLSTCEEKLMKLIEDLDAMGKNVNEVSQMMDEEEFQTTAQIKLPQYNTRVKLPAVAKDTIYDDEDASGEDEEIQTRQSLKKQSQQIVDAKTRRRPVKRKKKTTTK